MTGGDEPNAEYCTFTFVSSSGAGPLVTTCSSTTNPPLTRMVATSFNTPDGYGKPFGL